MTDISEPSQCRSLKLPDNLSPMRVRSVFKVVLVFQFLQACGADNIKLLTTKFATLHIQDKCGRTVSKGPNY